MNFDESPCRKGYNGYYTVTERGKTNVEVNLAANFSRDSVTVCPLVSALGEKHGLFILFKRITNARNLLPEEQQSLVDSIPNIIARGNESGTMTKEILQWYIENVYEPLVVEKASRIGL